MLNLSIHYNVYKFCSINETSFLRDFFLLAWEFGFIKDKIVESTFFFVSYIEPYIEENLFFLVALNESPLIFYFELLKNNDRKKYPSRTSK